MITKNTPGDISNMPLELRDEILRQKGVNFEECRAVGIDINVIFDYIAQTSLETLEDNIVPLEPVEELDYEFARLATQIQAGQYK